MEHNNSSPNLKTYNHYPKQNIDITSMISIELNKIDTDEIKNLMYTLVKNITEEQETYIYNLCIKIQEIKKGIIYKVYKMIKEKNQLEIVKENNNNESIINELKNLDRKSKIKFKQFDNLMTIDFENNFKKLNDFIQKGKIQHSLQQINILDEIRIKLKNSIQEIQSVQNDYLNNCSEILQTNIIDLTKSKSQRKTMTRNNTPTLRNKKSNSKKNLSPTYFKTSDNHNLKNNKNIDKEDEDSRIKITKKSEIENLKEQLKKEQEYKNLILRELNTLKYTRNINNISTLNISNLKQLEKKLNQLSDMVINFANSIRNINELTYKKAINNFEIKKIYKQLLKKLNDIANLNIEARQIEIKLFSPEESLYKFKELETSLDISFDGEDTSKEIKLKSQNKINKIGKIKNNNSNINTNNINEKYISFRDKNIIDSNLKNGGELEEGFENKINENNIEKLLNENKNLKSQIATLILSQDTIDEEIKKENEKLKKELENKVNIKKKNTNENENNGHNLSHEEKIFYETEILFLQSEINRLESESRTQNIISNVNLTNCQDEKIELEVKIDNLKKEIEELINTKKNIKNENNNNELILSENNNNELISNDNNRNSNNENNIISLDNNLIDKLQLTITNLNKKLEEKTDELNTLNASYQSEINELNGSIIVLKTKVEKLENEKDYLLSKNKENSSKQKIKFKSYSFHLNFEPIKINKSEKEDIQFLTKKNQCLIDDNKNLCDLVQELKLNIKKEKEQYKSLIKGSFEKFLSETKVDHKNKEYLIILLKILEYNENEINYILSIIMSKKKGNFLGLFSGK